MSIRENYSILIGNVATEPETHTFDSGDEVTEFQLAYEKSWKNDNGEWENYTSFFTVKAKYEDSDYVRKHLEKGDPVYVRCNLKQERWEKNGQNRSKVVLETRKVQKIDDGDMPSSSSSSSSEPSDVLNDVDPGGQDDDIPF